MMPRICQQCGGPIFRGSGAQDNPNICAGCTDRDLDDNMGSANLISLTPYLKAIEKGNEPRPTNSPETEAI